MFSKHVKLAKLHSVLESLRKSERQGLDGLIDAGHYDQDLALEDDEEATWLKESK
jgi:hypothetical protein